MELQINAEGQLVDGEGKPVKIGEEEVTVANAISKDKANQAIQDRLARQKEKITTLEAQAVKTPELERMILELKAEKSQMEENLSKAQSDAESKVANQLKTALTRAEQAEADLKAEREAHVRTHVTNSILGNVGDRFINPSDDIVPRLLAAHKREPVLGADGKPTGQFSDTFEVEVPGDKEGETKREFLPVDKALEAMAANPKMQHYVRSSQTGGPGAGSFGNTRVTKRSDLTSVKDKVDFIEKHGRPAFEALPA
jgi:hypothetical protein